MAGDGESPVGIGNFGYVVSFINEARHRYDFTCLGIDDHTRYLLLRLQRLAQQQEQE